MTIATAKVIVVKIAFMTAMKTINMTSPRMLFAHSLMDPATIITGIRASRRITRGTSSAKIRLIAEAMIARYSFALGSRLCMGVSFLLNLNASKREIAL